MITINRKCDDLTFLLLFFLILYLQFNELIKANNKDRFLNIIGHELRKLIMS